ncbi:TPA: hypothetical protein NGR89_004459 [Vibrio parahaemolyticus]|nr:hypothetical protein [Vibrio fluvialis]HCE1714964.1 hypothetical protein [Vibrio parahaemolyticus]
MVIQKGPATINVRGVMVPEWIETREGISDFNREAELDDDGGFEMKRLAPDECILYPGAIYRIRKH